MYASVASSKVIEVCFSHFWGCWSLFSCATIPELTSSWCSIPRTVQTTAVVDHGGFPWWEVINWSHSNLCKPVAWCTGNLYLLTTVCINSHPTACCFFFVLLPMLRMIYQCASWVIFWVAALAVSRWTNWCLYSCCVPMSDVFEEAPANRLNLDLLGPGWGDCVYMVCGVE